MARQTEDKKTLALPGVPEPKRRGRPASGNAMSAAERKRLQRQRAAEAGRGSLTVMLPLDLLQGLDDFVKFKDITKDSVIEKLLRAQLLRKR